MLKLLRINGQFRRYWFANILSVAGDLIDDIAFAQVVYLITKSTLLTAYVFAIKVVLSFLSILAATYIDRHSSKKVLTICEFGQALILLIFICLYINNYLNTALILLFVTCQTIFSSFATPASNSLIVHIVKREDLIDARASMNMVMQVLQVLAYGFAGVLIATISITGAFIFDMFTFIIAGFILLGINVPEKDISNENDKTSFGTDVKEGFGYVVKNKLIIGIVIVSFLGNAAVAPIDSLLPAFFEQESYGTNFYSIFMISIAIGSILGSWITSKFKNKVAIHNIYSFGFLMGTIGFSIIYLNNSLFIILGAFALGISMGNISVLTSTLLLLYTPKDKIARVFSIFKALTFIANPLGIMCCGAIGEFTKVRNIMPLMGIILLIASVLSFIIVKDGEKNDMTLDSMN